jgi:signal-transduction protein with cAMP-binding, CBS, and nucleotidyltransferase domain
MSVISVLRQADIFYELTNTQLELIASICEERHYQAGDTVFEENSPVMNCISSPMAKLRSR